MSLVLKQVVELDNLGMAYACLRVSVLASRPCRLGLSRASVAPRAFGGRGNIVTQGMGGSD